MSEKTIQTLDSRRLMKSQLGYGQPQVKAMDFRAAAHEIVTQARKGLKLTQAQQSALALASERLVVLSVTAVSMQGIDRTTSADRIAIEHELKVIRAIIATVAATRAREVEKKLAEAVENVVMRAVGIVLGGLGTLK